MTHEELLDLIVPYLDGAVTAEEKRRIEAHMAENPEFRAEVESLSRFVHQVDAELAPLRTGAPDARARILREIRKPTLSPRVLERPGRARPKFSPMRHFEVVNGLAAACAGARRLFADRSNRIMRAGIAVAIVAVIALTVWYGMVHRPPDYPVALRITGAVFTEQNGARAPLDDLTTIPDGTRVVTEEGSALRLQLAPGIHLETEGAAAFVMGGDHRLALDRGAVEVEVKPSAKPLSVQAGEVSLTADVGRFRVTRDGNTTTVNVETGRVTVEVDGEERTLEAGEGMQWPEAAEPPPVPVMDTKTSAATAGRMPPSGQAAPLVERMDGVAIGPLDIVGRLVDGENQPVTNATYKSYYVAPRTASRQSYLLDDEGRVNSQGEFHCKVGHEGWHNIYFAIPDGPDVFMERVATGQRGLVVQAPRGVDVSILVTDGNQVPVAGARATTAWHYPTGTHTSVRADERSAEIDETGRIHWENLAPVDHVLQVSHPDYAFFEDSLRLVPGNSAEKFVVLRPTALVSGRVFDEAGLPLPGIRIDYRHYDADGHGRGVTAGQVTDEDGRYRISGIGPGLITVKAVLREEVVAERRDRLTKNRMRLDDFHLYLNQRQRLQGRVENEAGEGIAGATVLLVRSFRLGQSSRSGEHIGKVVTDAMGHFTHWAPRPGEYALNASHNNYVNAEMEEFELGVDEEKDGLVIVLHEGSFISGRVMDRAGSPVAGALVYSNGYTTRARSLSGGRHDETTTGSDGSFTMANLHRDARYTLVAEADGFAPTRAFHIPVGTTGVSLVLTAGHTVRGRVVRKEDNRPVPGVLVSFVGSGPRSFHATTDQDGRYAAMNLSAGKYQVRLKGADGYVHSPRHWESPKEEASESEMDISLLEGARVSGRVVDQRTGEGIPDATVKIHEQTQPDTWTFYGDVLNELDGRFVTAPLPPGTFRFSALAAGYERVHPGVRPDYPTRTIDLAHDTDPVIVAIDRGGTVRGIVTFTDGKPASEVHVQGLIRNLERGTMTSIDGYTGPDGFYELSGIHAPATVEIRVHSQGRHFLTGRKDIHVEPGDPVDVNLVVPEAGSISGRVLTQNNTPLEGASIIVHAAVPDYPDTRGHSIAAGLTDAAGDFHIEGIHSAGAIVVAKKTGYLEAQVNGIEVHPGLETSGVVVRMDQGQVIGGVVRDHNGRPLEGAGVYARIRDPHRYTEAVTTDADGRFLLDVLPPGKHEVSATHPDTGQKLKVDDVEAGTEDLRLTFPGVGTVTVRAVDADTGRPLEDFRVDFLRQEGSERFRDFTGSNGLIAGSSYVQKGVPAGVPLKAGIHKHGYLESESHVFMVKPDEELGPITIRAKRGLVITGRLMAPDTGEPVESARAAIVKTDPPSLSYRQYARTREDGHFQFTAPASGQYRIDFTPPEDSDYAPLSLEPVAVRADRDIGDIHLDMGSILQGRVIYPDGNTLRGSLSLHGGQKEEEGVIMTTRHPGQIFKHAMVDANGTYTFTGLPADGYRITFHASGPDEGIEHVELVEVPGDATVNRDLVIAHHYFLEGRVLVNGESEGEGSIIFTPAGTSLLRSDGSTERAEGTIWTRVSEGGNYRAAFRAPGAYDIYVYRYPQHGNPAPRHLPAGTVDIPAGTGSGVYDIHVAD